MTVETTAVSKSYKPGAAMAPEAIPFVFLDPTDIAVTHVAALTSLRTPLAYGQDYVVTGNGRLVQGQVTALAAWPVDDQFVVERVTDAVQKAKIVPHEPVPAEEVEKQLDRMVLHGQEQRALAVETKGRALLVPIGSEQPDLTEADFSGRYRILALDPVTKTLIPADGSDFAGDPGPSNNTRLTLALLKAAAITDKTSLYDGSLWTWTPGDFTGQADDINIVKAENTALAMGAWVRQGAESVRYGSQRVAEKLAQHANLLDALNPEERADALTGFPTINTTAKINAFLLAHRYVERTEGTFLVDYIDIWFTLTSLRSQSKDQPIFRRAPGATGAMFRTNYPRLTFATFTGLYIIGNGEAGETCGFDLTGFGYCTFEDCRARLFKQDGWYTKGVISIDPNKNRQMSNNTLIDCIGNNNGRHGFFAEGESVHRYENTANVIIGGEFSGNQGYGVYGDVCEATKFIGVCTQSNEGGDVYFNSRYCDFDNYIESRAKSIVMGPLSYGCNVSVRSSYPLWNTFIDNGTANHLSVKGEYENERHMFANPYFSDWVGAVPAGLALNGVPIVASYADAGSPMGAGLDLTVNANFQGLIFTLLATPAELQGRYASLIVEADTSGVIEPLETRIYTRDGDTRNQTNGEYAIETLTVTATGRFTTLAWDIRFAETISGVPTILWYLAWSGVTGANKIKIRSARIVLGQTRAASWPMTDLAKTPAATTTQIQDASAGINIHRKQPGRTVFDSATGKLYVATGSTPTAPWSATDGSGTLTTA